MQDKEAKKSSKSKGKRVKQLEQGFSAGSLQARSGPQTSVVDPWIALKCTVNIANQGVFGPQTLIFEMNLVQTNIIENTCTRESFEMKVCVKNSFQ